VLAQADIRALPIPDNSVDLIFTDPPYVTEYIWTYEWLANEAMRVLRPGGFCLAMCGGLHLPKVYSYFEASGLKYFFDFYQKSRNDAPTIWKHANGKSLPIVAKVKPIIAYSKGISLPQLGSVMNMFETSDGWSEAKRFHRWGQDVNTCRYYIEYFSKRGDLVFDPFIGGGTTLIASELIGRRCVGFDVDFAALQTTQARRNATEIPTPLELWKAE